MSNEEGMDVSHFVAFFGFWLDWLESKLETPTLLALAPIYVLSARLVSERYGCDGADFAMTLTDFEIASDRSSWIAMKCVV